jgi:hypothetical protein
MSEGSNLVPLDAMCGAEMLDDVHDFLGRFVAYPSSHAQIAHVLWIAHAHLMDAWESTPRIAFLSPEPGSGKTRALEISELLVPNPVIGINVSPAYLFRKVGDPGNMPTLLYDEIDTVFGPRAKDNEEIRALLNAGHRRGAVAGRCVTRGKIIETEEISAYCAVALAGIGDLPLTILDRSVVVKMRRRAPNETVEPFRRRVHRSEGEELRKRLATWAEYAREAVTDAWPSMPEGIHDRNADIWEPLLAVADAVGGAWPERARVTAVTLVMLSRERETSLGLRLLFDLRSIFGNADTLSTVSLLDALLNLNESPWGDIRGRPLNDRGLAARLRQHEIKPKVIRFGDTTARGYAREDFIDAWARYLPCLPPGSITTVTPVTGLVEIDVDVSIGAAASSQEDDGDPFASLKDSSLKLKPRVDDYPQLPEFLNRRPVS